MAHADGSWLMGSGTRHEVKADSSELFASSSTWMRPVRVIAPQKPDVIPGIPPWGRSMWGEGIERQTWGLVKTSVA